MSLHRKQIFNVFTFKKRTENKKTFKNVKRDKSKKRKNVFTSMLEAINVFPIT